MFCLSSLVLFICSYFVYLFLLCLLVLVSLQEGYGPVHYAAVSNCIDLVVLLIDRGFSVNDRSKVGPRVIQTVNVVLVVSATSPFKLLANYYAPSYALLHLTYAFRSLDLVNKNGAVATIRQCKGM